MLSAIDHVVCVVSDLALVAQGLREAGFNVVPGGRHPIGTENCLIPFADGTYIEVVGFREKNTSHRWWPLLERGGGLVDICGTSDDVSADVAAFRAAGIPYTDPRELGRVRPDGYELKFSVANPTEHVGVINFLCQDLTPRSERVPPARNHANGTVGLERVIVAVAELSKPRICYETLLRASGREVIRPALGGKGLAFKIGRHEIEYLTPSGEGEIARHLDRNGSSVYAARQDRLHTRDWSSGKRKRCPPHDLSHVEHPAVAARPSAACYERLLGVTDDSRDESAPNVLTFKGQGVEFSYSAWEAIHLPKAASPELLAKLERASRAALAIRN